jgi:uncharacterized protein YbjT (DUF2867 family)
MRIVVIGGSGLIGRGLVANLRRQGHEVFPASPSSGVNTLTGEGLDEAMAGAKVVVDVSNSPSFEGEAAMAFFRTSTRNLLEAVRKAGVGHLVALSVVGTDRLQQNGYFRAKVAQEELIAGSQVPFTIVRATQFFEFIEGIAKAGSQGETVRISNGLFQPIAAQDVSALLAAQALREPLNGTMEIGGPEILPMDVAVSRFLQATGDRRTVVAAADAPYFGQPVVDDALVAAASSVKGGVAFERWLQERAKAGIAESKAA